MPVSRSGTRKIQFWFEFASTYSYPAAMRIERAAEQAGVALAWKPFLLGPIFRSQGWSDSPFNLYSAKGRYMWRDLERTCEKEGLPFRRPTQFPRNGLLAARVAVAGLAEPWCPTFIREVYRANFAEDREIADPQVLADLLRRVSPAAGPALDRASSEAVKQQLRAHGDEAAALGIFGAPSFLVGRELFWGNDRLDEALAWATAP
ncbi:MAG TPA: 2-hydroxychromene-2-carboxylate isomerase [Myxococcota bacterium]|nr:2-hydroxychromene-2-carboxylate isomerase [Myxococcota bacterium]